MTGHDEDRIEGLGALYADREPRPELEDAVIERLRHDLPLKAVRRRRPSVRLLQAASVVLLAGASWLAGRSSAPSPPGDGALSSSAYMLLLWDSETFDPGVPPETIAAEYEAWAAQTARAGQLIDGNELGLDRVLLGDGAEHAPDGVMSGYFIVQGPAESARELAANHPHVGYGGRIEVAPIIVR
ncbi:MAG: hypothetical protein AAF389_02515 [Gemmatimonadota bacterium]